MVAAASSLLPWSTTQLLFTHNFTFKPTKIKTSITAAAASSHSNNTFIEYGSYNFQTKSALASLNCSFNEEASENLYQPDSESQQSTGFWSKWKANSAEMSSKLAKLGLSAVLAYGLFDAVTYTTFFVLAFLGYEKSTGKNPAANLQALLGIVILMWTGNNVTRPFRVAGAAALAPLIDGQLKKIQNYFKLTKLVYAFALIVSIVASVCLTVVGLLILSRWGR